MTDILQVGVISSTHGIHGEVKVYPTTDDIQRFKKLKTVIMDPDGLNMLLHIRSVRFQKGMVLIQFDEFDSPESADRFRSKELYVTRDQAVPLKEDENFIVDLIGLDVVLENKEPFGKLTDVLQTGANDVYVIDHDGREVLIPAIKSCVLSVNLEQNLMTIHLLQGLLD